MNFPFLIREYELIEKIGDGAFSSVYKAIKKESPNIYAIKVIEKSVLINKDDQNRMQRELDSCAFLRHDSIVPLLDFFSDENRFYLVLEYCSGGDLYTFIHTSNRIREVQAASVFYQIVSAVHYIHSMGVAHRDLKPQNILITNFPQVKVTDFGLCGYIIDETKMRTFCGSPFYSAPECLKQIQYDGKLSDIWSLGVILYELVSGEHPWTSSNTGLMIKQITSANYQMPKDLTPACEDLIRSLLKVKPSDRLTVNDILIHPWLKLANSKKSIDKSNLPPLLKRPIPSIANLIDRSSLPSDHGIVSPFIGITSPLISEGLLTPPAPKSNKKFPIRSRSGSTINKISSNSLPKKENSTSSFGSILNQKKLPPKIPKL